MTASFVITSLFAASAAQAQTAPPNASDQPPAASTTPSTPSQEPSSPAAPPSDQAAALAPPAVLPTQQAATPPKSWFYRAPYEIKLGEGTSQWKLTAYGFVEFDMIYDTTRSFQDSEGNGPLQRDGTNGGLNGRTMFVSRNSRFGFKMNAPVIDGIKPSAVLEGDWFGTLPGNPPGGSPTPSESAFYTSDTLRIRHAYVKLENDVVDVLAGQFYNLFGWQSYFFPCSLEFLPLPNMVFGRTIQLRLSKTIKSDAVNFDMAIAALRPPQRDSTIPDGQAGLRLGVNQWKGITTPGNGGTAAVPAALGVSGAVRRFRVDSYPSATNGSGKMDTGWGLSVDALIPIIPVANSDDRGNALTLTGSFVTGSGIGDLIGGLSGGANFPATNPVIPPAVAGGMPTGGGNYAADIDNGMVAYDSVGQLHTIDWTTFQVGLQYYLPPSGRVILSGNYTQANSKNMGDLFPNSKGQYKAARYVDGNLFFDLTPSVRLGGSYQYTEQTYVDGQVPKNHRLMGTALYFF